MTFVVGLYAKCVGEYLLWHLLCPCWLSSLMTGTAATNIPHEFPYSLSQDTFLKNHYLALTGSEITLLPWSGKELSALKPSLSVSKAARENNTT